MTDFIEITRTFEASPARVFDAWLEREQWQSWIGPVGITCEVPLLEPRVGGRYRLTMHLADGGIIPVAGEFKVVDRPQRFAMTWGREGGSEWMLVTVTLRDLGSGRTELTLRHENLDTAESRESHRQGWSSALGKLDTYLTKAAA